MIETFNEKAKEVYKDKSLSDKSKLDSLIRIREQAMRNFTDNERSASELFEFWEHGLDVIQNLIDKVSSSIRLSIKMEDIVFKPIPEKAHIILLKDFKKWGFIDYDGSGSYCTDTHVSNVSVYASDKKFRKDFDKLVWYNR